MTPIFPQMKTERFILRRISTSDAKDLYDYFSKDEVTKYYDLNTFTTIQQALDLIERWEARFQENDGIRWGIATRKDNKLIGSCGFHNWSKEHHKAEIGYEVSPKYWRQGVITEVLKDVIQHGFVELNLHRIEAFYDPENIASKRALEKAGFRHEGVMRECFWEKGKFVDAAVCALLRRDFMVTV
ncbi:GNAT family N-acetyltransferase [Alicyclobacillus fodiniaquatilis]|uniref:GNAT family N-acetyltransferase n=1 Tax=Alicyclobacillus fodiniaquatilis TaxID=1661150 RepID=A0ABW4JH56_9BACL